MMISVLLEMYAKYGKSLRNTGVLEAVLPIAATGELLNIVALLEWTVLGGDVYVLDSEGEFVPDYSNWYYEGGSSADSIATARAFVEKIKQHDAFVSFVFDCKISRRS